VLEKNNSSVVWGRRLSELGGVGLASTKRMYGVEVRMTDEQVSENMKSYEVSFNPSDSISIDTGSIIGNRSILSAGTNVSGKLKGDNDVTLSREGSMRQGLDTLSEQDVSVNDAPVNEELEESGIKGEQSVNKTRGKSNTPGCCIVV